MARGCESHKQHHLSWNQEDLSLFRLLRIEVATESLCHKPVCVLGDPQQGGAAETPDWNPGAYLPFDGPMTGGGDRTLKS